MPILSGDRAALARNIETRVMRAAQRDATQEAIGIALGVNKSTVSRLLTDHLPNLAGLMAALGLKVVDADSRCVSRETYEFLTRTHARVMHRAPELIWEDTE